MQTHEVTLDCTNKCLGGCTALCARALGDAAVHAETTAHAAAVSPPPRAQAASELGCYADCTEKCVRVCATE